MSRYVESVAVLLMPGNVGFSVLTAHHTVQISVLLPSVAPGILPSLTLPITCVTLGKPSVLPRLILSWDTHRPPLPLSLLLPPPQGKLSFFAGQF